MVTKNMNTTINVALYHERGMQFAGGSRPGKGYREAAEGAS